MPDHGDALGADLYKLLIVGQQDLPSIAEIYHEGVGDVDAAGGQAASAMNRPAYFGGGSGGPVHDSWAALQQTVQSLLKQTASNLDDTGHALVLAVNAYAAADTGARDKLTSLRSVNGEPKATVTPK
ncbi:hypothetical protein [Hamadaea tsunoensis]|uniref:hypothetical protein n=1 Tax=Hamadaea tsunoensis TaxID=53368 RepID=UPI000424CF0C|nr:hypothetical protein [Hamadaea tsunoensis]